MALLPLVQPAHDLQGVRAVDRALLEMPLSKVRRLVAVLIEDIRHRRELADAIVACVREGERAAPAHQSRARGRTRRAAGVVAGGHEAGASQPVEVWRDGKWVVVRSGQVEAQVVAEDEHEVWPGGGRGSEDRDEHCRPCCEHGGTHPLRVRDRDTQEAPFAKII